MESNNPASFPRRNLELKARCAGLHAAAARMRQLAARDGGLEVQTDTYFCVPSRRLKLREIAGQSAALIGYARPDQTGARLSNYHLVPVMDAAALKALLSDVLGVRGVVAKRRHIYLWHNVRIHLDEVAGLGSFIEFEAVLTCPADEAAAPAQLDELCHLLGIAPVDHLAPSYADLLGL
jgi:predicted adenylyl cyclase CyaB